MSCYPVHRGGKIAAAQRQAGLRADEGLHVRLLRGTRRPPLGAGRADAGPLIDTLAWPTRGARRAAVEYMGWYNGNRLHSTLGYQSPVDYKQPR